MREIKASTLSHEEKIHLRNNVIPGNGTVNRHYESAQNYRVNDVNTALLTNLEKLLDVTFTSKRKYAIKAKQFPGKYSRNLPRKEPLYYDAPDGVRFLRLATDINEQSKRIQHVCIVRMSHVNTPDPKDNQYQYEGMVTFRTLQTTQLTTKEKYDILARQVGSVPTTENFLTRDRDQQRMYELEANPDKYFTEKLFINKKKACYISRNPNFW